MKTGILIFLLMLALCFSVDAQNKMGIEKNTGFKGGRTETPFSGFIFPSHDSILHVNLATIELIGPFRFKNKHEKKKYNQTEVDVLKTYPLALIVSSELKIVNAQLENNDSDPNIRKTYIKWYQQYVYKTYIDTLKTLNTRQGRLQIGRAHV